MSRAALFAIAIVVAATGCHRPKRYSATAEVKRISAPRTEAEGQAGGVAEIELEYTRCPGAQIEVVRGDAEFAGCLEKLAHVGGTVPIAVEHRWSDEGHWDHEVLEIAGCRHRHDPHEEGSFKIVRECHDTRSNDTPVGFRCNTVANEELVKACPWFER